MDAINKAKISLDVDSWWTPAFGAALKSGKLASFVTGAFHVSILKKTAPEASGLWRIQLAPTIDGGHKSGLFAGGARTVAITSQSENQDAAWNFIHYMMLDENGIKATWEEELSFLRIVQFLVQHISMIRIHTMGIRMLDGL